LNLRRQKEENQIADEAYRMIEDTVDLERERVIVLANDEWQQGIIGIVSSRITDRYGLPSILISFDGTTDGVPLGTDVGKGSGRSVKGMNLVEALIDSESLLVRFGGHELAAGLSIRRCNVDAFRQHINQYAQTHLDEDSFCVSLDADCEVEMNELSMRLAQEISLLEPFGIANPVPNLILRDARVLRMVPMGAGKHTRMVLSKDGVEMTAVRFGESLVQMSVREGDLVDVLFQLNVNEYQNVTSLQMIVQDIRYADSFVKEYRAQKARYEDIKNGAKFSEEENILPSRDDMAVVYTMLRKEFRAGATVFTVGRLLMMLEGMGRAPIGYAKLKFIIRIMQELRICDVIELSDDFYNFSFQYMASKTSIEKSSILHKLKSQLTREA
jgi:single-stranded-DNA-specific exonuclease